MISLKIIFIKLFHFNEILNLNHIIWKNSFNSNLYLMCLRWLVGVVVTKEKILEAKQIFNDHFGADIYNEEVWMHICEVMKY